MNIKDAKQTFLDIKRILDQLSIKFWLVDELPMIKILI